jgi:hypothetical protein
LIRAAVAAVLLAVLAAGAGGCTLDPSVADTLPPIERHGVRITKGPGTSSDYEESAEVVSGNVVQVLTLIADGNSVVVNIPRGPADELTVTARAENGDTVESTLRSATGEPITVHRLFLFDPGYIGVENHSNDEELELRIATPRLTGAGQGQVPFTFKTKVR